MQKYENLIKKLKKVYCTGNLIKKIVGNRIVNEILRSNNLNYQIDLILYGYYNNFPNFTFENRVELIQGRWYFNGSTIDKITDDEKRVFQIELIILKIRI